MEDGRVEEAVCHEKGGAPYANIMAPELRAYAEDPVASGVGKATISNWSRRTVPALKKRFRGKGIAVADEYFCAHMLHIRGRIDAARKFERENG